MADNGVVIKEFLIGLGFKMDAAAAAKMQGAIGEVSRSIVKLGEVWAATQVAVEAAVVAIASKMEDLYFAAQRAGATAQNLSALRYAAEQAGIGADAVTAAVANMRIKMLQNRGLEALVNLLGVQTRDMKGKARDTEQVFQDLMDNLSKMDFMVASQYAAKLGISADMLLMWKQNGEVIKQGVKDYNAELGRMGLNDTDVANKSHELMTKLRSLEMVFLALSKTIMINLAPSFLWFVDKAKDIVHWLEDLDKKTKGWSTTIGVGLVTSLTVLSAAWKIFNLSILSTGIGAAVAGVIALGVAIYALVQDFEKWKATGQSLIPWDKWKPEIDAAVKGLQQAWGLIQSSMETPLKQVRGAFDSLVLAISKLTGGPTTDVVKAFNRIADAVGADAREALWEGLKVGLRIVTGMLGAVTSALNLITDILNGKWVKAWHDAVKLVQDLLGMLYAPLLVLAEDFGGKYVASIELGITKGWQGFAAYFKGLWNDVTSFDVLQFAEDFGGKLVDSISLGITKGWQKFVAYFDGLVKNLFGILPDWANPFAGGSGSPGEPAPGAAGRFRSGGPHQTGVQEPTIAESIWKSLFGGKDYGPKVPEGATKDAMNFFQKMHWTAEQAAGIVSNLLDESGMDPGAVNATSGAFGIAQWLGSRQDDLLKFAQTTGGNAKSMQTQLEFVQFELTQGHYKPVGDALRKITDAQKASNLIGDDYEIYGPVPGRRFHSAMLSTKLSSQPAPVTSADQKARQPANATLNQTTQIHVSGTGDALTTARHVADAQSRVNGDTVRNLVSVLDLAPVAPA